MATFGSSGTVRNEGGSTASQRAKQRKRRNAASAYGDDTISKQYSYSSDILLNLTIEHCHKGNTFAAPRMGRIEFCEGDETKQQILPVSVAKKLKRFLDEVDDIAYEQLLTKIAEIETSCAVQRVVQLVNKRDYAVSEVQSKLAQQGYSKHVIDDVVARSLAGNLLDDKRYADAFIRSSVRKGLARSRIEAELAKKGIAADELAGYPYDYFEKSEAERALALLEGCTLPNNNPYDKLFRFLLNKGYTPSIAHDAVKRHLQKFTADSSGGCNTSISCCTF